MDDQQQDASSNTGSDTTSPGRGSPASQPSDAGGHPVLPSSAGAVVNSASVATGTPRVGGRRRNRHGGADWEIMQGLRSGQRCNDRPSKFEGYLLKRRKWPLKGWHKRFFCLDKGMLTYAKSSTDMAKGKIHGSVDLGLSVISTKSKGRRVDIDAEEFIYHLKVKNQAQFQQWISQLRHHRLYRQHEIAFGSRDAPKMTSPVAEDSASIAMTGGKASCWPSSLCCYACDRVASKDTSTCDIKGSTFSLSLQSTTHQCYRDLTYERPSVAESFRQGTFDPQTPSCGSTMDKKEKPCLLTLLTRKQRCPQCSPTLMTDKERRPAWKTNDLRCLRGITGLLSHALRHRGLEVSTGVAESSLGTTASANACCGPVNFVHHEAANNEITGGQKFTTCGVDTNEDSVLFVPVEDGMANHTGGIYPNEVDGVFDLRVPSGNRTRDIIDFFEQASVSATPATPVQQHLSNKAPPYTEGECSPSIIRRGNEIGIDTDHGSKLKIYACGVQTHEQCGRCHQHRYCCKSNEPSSHDCSSYKSAVNEENFMPPPPPPKNSDESEILHMKKDFGPQNCSRAGSLANWSCSTAKLQQCSKSSRMSSEQYVTSYSTVYRDPSVFTGTSFKTLSMAGSTTDKVALHIQRTLSERGCKHPKHSLSEVKPFGTCCHNSQETQCKTSEWPCIHGRIASPRNAVRQNFSFCAQMDGSARSYDEQTSTYFHGPHFSNIDKTSGKGVVPVTVAKSLSISKRSEQFQGRLLEPDTTVPTRTVDKPLREEHHSSYFSGENDMNEVPSATSDTNPRPVKIPRIFLYSRSDCTFVKDPVQFLAANKGKIEKA